MLWMWQRHTLNVCGSKPHHLHMQTTQTLPAPPITRKHLKTEIDIDVHHCSSVAHLYCDLTMFVHCELVILILALTLDGQGEFGFYGIIYCFTQGIIVCCLNHRT